MPGVMEKRHIEVTEELGTKLIGNLDVMYASKQDEHERKAGSRRWAARNGAASGYTHPAPYGASGTRV
jgi:hypothetical protein